MRSFSWWASVIMPILGVALFVYAFANIGNQSVLALVCLSMACCVLGLVFAVLNRTAPAGRIRLGVAITAASGVCFIALVTARFPAGTSSAMAQARGETGMQAPVDRAVR